MAAIKAGDLIGVICTVQPGPFSDERLINIETVDGSISGFVSENELKQIREGWTVRAIVQAVQGDHLEVLVNGSFFTTNGLATVQRSYAMAA